MLALGAASYLKAHRARSDIRVDGGTSVFWLTRPIPAVRLERVHRHGFASLCSADVFAGRPSLKSVLTIRLHGDAGLLGRWMAVWWDASEVMRPRLKRGMEPMPEAEGSPKITIGGDRARRRKGERTGEVSCGRLERQLKMSRNADAG